MKLKLNSGTKWGLAVGFVLGAVIAIGRMKTLEGQASAVFVRVVARALVGTIIGWVLSWERRRGLGQHCPAMPAITAA